MSKRDEIIKHLSVIECSGDDLVTWEECIPVVEYMLTTIEVLGYSIVPTKPSEGMMNANYAADNQEAIWPAMLAEAKKEMNNDL